MRWCQYGRFGTDMQNASSIEDQLRVCRERCDHEDWTFVGAYADAAVSGTTRLRPGYQRLLQDARDGKFDIVVAEDLSRLSRDLEDIAHLYKQLTFSKVRLFTLSEGWISEIHVGLDGTMAALYVRQLAEKTHRGIRGRIEAGMSGGGITLGYKIVRTPKGDGTFEVGGRTRRRDRGGHGA